jgi:hypothetical protein
MNIDTALWVAYFSGLTFGIVGALVLTYLVQRYTRWELR